MDDSLADFDEETKAVLKDAQISVYNEYEVRLAIVDKISALYKEDNFNGLIDFFVFLCSINADDFSVMTTNPENTVYDICFTSDFIDSFRAIVSENGVALESSLHIMDEYTYGGLQFGFCSDINDRREERFYIKVYHSEDSGDFDYVIISGEIYRRLQNEKYKYSSQGYFLVGETIELIEEENETSEDDANKYYPAARCPKCGISFRANTMRARKIAEYGYCGMGLCSKD
jgi:hypothetical protein